MPMIVIVNVTVSPATMPNGRRRPPVPLADSSAGSTGSTHGVTAVAAPARRAKRRRTIIREEGVLSFAAYGCMTGVGARFIRLRAHAHASRLHHHAAAASPAPAARAAGIAVSQARSSQEQAGS